MEREISDDIEIANSFMLFQSIRKSPAVDKTASVFDKLNLNVKKKTHWTWDLWCKYCLIHPWDARLTFFQGMIGKIKTVEQPANTSYKDKEVLEF